MHQITHNPLVCACSVYLHLLRNTIPDQRFGHTTLPHCKYLLRLLSFLFFFGASSGSSNRLKFRVHSCFFNLVFVQYHTSRLHRDICLINICLLPLNTRLILVFLIDCIFVRDLLNTIRTSRSVS